MLPVEPMTKILGLFEENYENDVIATSQGTILVCGFPGTENLKGKRTKLSRLDVTSFIPIISVASFLASYLEQKINFFNLS